MVFLLKKYIKIDTDSWACDWKQEETGLELQHFVLLKPSPDRFPLAFFFIPSWTVSSSLFNGPKRERYRPVFSYKTKRSSFRVEELCFGDTDCTKCQNMNFLLRPVLSVMGQLRPISGIIHYQQIYRGLDRLSSLFTTSNTLCLNVFVYQEV